MNSLFQDRYKKKIIGKKETKISYGILLFFYDKTIRKNKFLLIRRKDSIEYVNFIRGIYRLNNLEHLTKIINRMTIEEISNIQTSSFENLWEKLWMKSLDVDNLKIEHKKNYEKAYNKFMDLRNKNKLASILKSYKSNWLESEWGFPKGRKNTYESDIEAAIREFTEETGINNDYYIILNSKEFIEEYIGTDGKIYKHIYYLAKYINKNIDLHINPSNRHQITEISLLKFFTLEEAIYKFRSYHIEKINIIKEADKYILDNELYKFKPYSINKKI